MLSDLWTLTLEISVAMAQFPSKEIARLSYDYRTLGLGYANIGGLLMSCGIPYDSDEGRAICGALSAVLTGRAYATSAEIAAKSGAFPGFRPNADAMLRVIRNHKRAADGEVFGYEELSVAPTPLDHASLIKAGPAFAHLGEAARDAWSAALALGEAHGFRNAQVSVVAPTGTIGLVMDCDTTGIEPDFALVKFKKLAGGGYFKIINRAVPDALRALGYDERRIEDIIAYAVGRATLAHAPGVNHSALRAKGLPEAAIDKVEAALRGAFDIRFVFNKWTLGAETLSGALKIPAERYEAPGFDLLSALGFTRAEIEAANIFACGAMTLEGAPHLKLEALPGVRLRQSLRPDGQALSLCREPHPHDGGGAAVHHRGDFQDHQHAERRHGRGLQGRLHAVLAARPQGERPLPRRVETVAAAQRPIGRVRRRGRGGAGDADRVDRAGARGAGRRKNRRASDRAGRAHARARKTARPPQGLHPEGGRRRAQGLLAHRRVPGRAARRDLSSTCTRRARPSGAS